MNHTDITPHIIPRRQWLVAYVQSCLEKKTAERLKAMGVEYYLPIQSEIRQWSDRRKKVDRLVIPMMIFVHVTPQERPLPLTLQAISRYMVLRGESRPAVIPEEQMERFRFMLDYSPEAVEICSTPLAAGDAVKVIKGPLAGLEGELVMIGGKSKVAVRLDMLGCAHVDMPIGYVERINFYPIIYFNVLILILSIYILFQWGNLLGFPIFYARFQVNQNVSSVKLCF